MKLLPTEKLEKTKIKTIKEKPHPAMKCIRSILKTKD